MQPKKRPGRPATGKAKKINKSICLDVKAIEKLRKLANSDGISESAWIENKILTARDAGK